MPNLRTEKTITALVWTLIIDGKTAARVYRKKSTVKYLTVAYDDATDPNVTGPVVINPDTETVEEMFFDANNDWFFQNPSTGYVWAAPYGDKDGKLSVTS